MKRGFGAIKLSKAQEEVIKRLQANDIIHYLDGINARCFYSKSLKSISWATIHRLEVYDLVERTDRHLVLTKNGEAYGI